VKKRAELSALDVECYAIGLHDTSLLSSGSHAVADDPCNVIDLICSTVQSAASFYTRRIRLEEFGDDLRKARATAELDDDRTDYGRFIYRRPIVISLDAG